MGTVIKVENLSKAYQIGQIGTGTISRDIERFWKMRVLGQEDPYLKIGETNDRSTKGNSDIVWSLKDINFEIQQGEAIGIIGKNGAGKSTLLKILSRVTSPTRGKIHIKGRVASLLEVGTGFHPELSGRENIYLNGAILGMRKKEITRKLDEIIDFSGVERYIDTPVKRYSSGMYVRLAFAVAAHLESEIMIVDEVLAVGDAEFQKKCLGKIKDVSSNDGRTVLFVSHNLAAVKQLCTKGILLQNGALVFSGDTNQTVARYLSGVQEKTISNAFQIEKSELKDIQVISANVVDGQNGLRNQFDISEPIYFTINVNCSKQVPNAYGYVVVQNDQEEVFIESDTFDFLPNCMDNLNIGDNWFKLRINSNVLPFGEYSFYLNFTSTFADKFELDSPGNLLKFSVVDSFTQRGQRRTARSSQLLKWETLYVK